MTVTQTTRSKNHDTERPTMTTTQPDSPVRLTPVTRPIVDGLGVSQVLLIAGSLGAVAVCRKTPRRGQAPALAALLFAAVAPSLIRVQGRTLYERAALRVRAALMPKAERVYISSRSADFVEGDQR